MAIVQRGLDGFAHEADGQATFFEALCPVYASLLREAVALTEDDADVRSGLLGVWSAREFHARYERPLLLLASIRFEAQRNASHPLAPAIARDVDVPASVSRDAVREALLDRVALASMRDRYVQTNEVTRAIAWRLPLPTTAAGRPVVLCDLGCSAGLNLVAERIDSVHLRWTDEAGKVITLDDAKIVSRIGFDRAPIDPRDRDAADWLRAAMWPGQKDRRARLDAALACACEAIDKGEMRTERADALEWPAGLERASVTADADGAIVFAYQTIVRDYFLPAVRDAYDAAMREWLLRHEGRAAWCELERAPDGSDGPVEIRLHEANAGAVSTRVIGACDYHPSIIHLKRTA